MPSRRTTRASSTRPGNDFRLAQRQPDDRCRGPLDHDGVGGQRHERWSWRDASYFYDGHGIDREIGDTIQLTGGAGSSDVAVVKAIDYAANTLTLDRALTWAKGQGVALRYAGTAPDMGAFEFGIDTGSPASYAAGSASQLISHRIPNGSRTMP